MYQEARPVAVPLLFRSKVRIKMTPLDAAIAWIQKGFSPVPIPHRSKRPILKEWEQLEITTDAAPQYFNGNQQNIRASWVGQHSFRCILERRGRR
jgi:hypothetical protein